MESKLCEISAIWGTPKFTTQSNRSARPFMLVEEKQIRDMPECDAMFGTSHEQAQTRCQIRNGPEPAAKGSRGRDNFVLGLYEVLEGGGIPCWACTVQGSRGRGNLV